MTLDNGHDFKKAGTIRGAFEYQDLVAVEILIHFLRHPDLYEWVQVEVEDRTYQAIDDVVACRSDGKLELTQVKFTPDPQNADHLLSWEWLTSHKPKGTSLLQKWAKTLLAHKRAKKLAQAMLKTDRIPDLEFMNCLRGQRVSFSRLNHDTRTVVLDQLGSKEVAIEFFNNFEFVHSQERFDDYEDSLRVKLENELDKYGWAHFRHQVRHWAMRRNSPGPDGKIRHYHLIHAFAVDRATTLRQDFAVPRTFAVPDKEFHHSFTHEITSTDGVTVLWGPPGRGKSTYLSHCVSELADDPNIVSIRHHYFLRLDEGGDARFSYFAIERSLIKQLADVDLIDSSNKRELNVELVSVAAELRASDRRLLIVIDGLDHVWRRRADLMQLQALFNVLLPLPEGVHLLVGTQKVEDDQLPTRLLTELPKTQWTELPNMSVGAVREWLMYSTTRDQILVEENPTIDYQDAINDLASALHEVSGGLPLHLVYTLEALLKTGNQLTVDSVLQLPACPEGGIESYYESLWVVLSTSAQRVLHLLAGLEFAPPSFGLGVFLKKDVDWWEVQEEIAHLLDFREASVVPFHISLFTFLRNRPEHKQAFTSLSEDVLNWLENESSQYWNRAWLWVMKAGLGHSESIINSTTREWAIDWLVSGYPVDQLIYILNRAEEEALREFDLRSLIRLRCMKSRVLFARRHQFNEWESFWETSLALSMNAELGSILWDRLHTLEADELTGIATYGAGVPGDALNRTIEELKRRDVANSGLDLSHSDVCSRASVRLLARQEKQQIERVITIARDHDAEGLISEYTSECLRIGNYENVLAMASQHRRGLGRDAFAALCLEGIGPNVRSDLLCMHHPAIRCLAVLKDEHAMSSVPDLDVSVLWRMNDDFGVFHTVQSAAYDVFFNVLTVALSQGVSPVRVDLGETGSGTWLGNAILQLERMARHFGSGYIDSQQWPTLSEIYSAFKLALPSEVSFRERSEIGGVRFALRDIAVDLCILGTGILGKSKIDENDIREVNKSHFWSSEAWLETFYDRFVPILSKGRSRHFLELGCWRT